MSSQNVASQTIKSQLNTTNRGIQVKLKHKKHEFQHIPEEPLTVFSCDFEIFGIVQGVSFRHYTLRRAQKLNVRGWCMFSTRGTMHGVIQGTPRNFEAMRIWLKYTGSPTSRIDKCVFKPTVVLNEFTYEDFSIRQG